MKEVASRVPGSAPLWFGENWQLGGRTLVDFFVKKKKHSLEEFIIYK